jgi:glycosyltransferase involved in cell wall biosynthesis
VTRIALVCEPPDGGVAEHVYHLAAGLPDHSYDVIVFAPPNFGPGGVDHPLPLVRDYRHPWRDAAALRELARAVRGFALVHAHAAKAGVLGRLAARRAGVPAVYTPHCFPFVGEISTARRRFGLTVERALTRSTAATICVCEDERRVAVAAGLERLEVVYNGCPPCDRVAPDSTLEELRAHGPLVGSVTVLRRQKALETLLDAALRMPDARIVIVGDGPERAALVERAARLTNVAFLPYSPPAARYLRALDVYVLPSAWEAFSIGVLEAQACGVPQVVTDVGGTREAVVSETGILVPPRDPARLADAIVELLRDPARRAAMADASRARHAERFTVERMVAETAAVYDRVLGQA